MRATGQVLRDQFLFLLRAGFDAFDVVKAGRRRQRSRKRRALQRVLPADRRRPHDGGALRAAHEAQPGDGQARRARPRLIADGAALSNGMAYDRTPRFRRLAGAAARRSGTLLLIDIRSAVDGGGEAAYLQAHVPGAVHTDYAKHGWRATKGMASGLLPERGIPRNAVRRSRADAGAPCHHHFGRHLGRRFQRRGAGLLDAEDRGPRRGLAARWRHGGVAGAGRSKQASHAATPAAGLSGQAARRSALRCARRRRPRLRHGDAVMLDSRSEGYFAGREKSPQAKRAGRLPTSLHLDHTRVFDPATKRLKSMAELAALFSAVAGKADCQLLQHRPSGRDQLVRAVGNPAPPGEALRRLDVGMDRGRHAAGRVDSRLTARVARDSARPLWLHALACAVWPEIVTPPTATSIAPIFSISQCMTSPGMTRETPSQRAGHDDVAGIERVPLRRPRDLALDAHDHQFGIGRLPHLAVHRAG